MLDEYEIKRYLNRIGLNNSFTLADLPTVERLNQLQLAHLYHVPFENLSIILKQPLSLGGKTAYHKIVEDHRGGFCYELNYAFYQLLSSLHFDVQLLSAQVYNVKNKTFGQPYDHLLLLIRLNEQDYIVDVGFGDSFVEPINVNTKQSQQKGGIYQLVKESSDYVLSRHEVGGISQIQYRFSLSPKTIEAFSSMFIYHQTSSQSTFTQKTVCSRLTDYGRITYSQGRLIRTEDNKKDEFLIADENEVRKVFLKEFDILFSEQECLARLIS